MQRKVYEVTAAESLARILGREGVAKVFGVASGYLSVALDAMRRGGIDCITNLHEGAAAFAAAGYSLASGRLGVVYGQAGPGVTNTLTGVAAAYADSVPMLVLASQSHVGSYGRDGHQEATGATLAIDQLDIFSTCSVARYRPTTAETATSLARRAVAAALHHRSVGVIEYGADLFNDRVSFEDLEPAEYRAHSALTDAPGLARLAELLQSAKAPVLLVGHRANHRGLGPDLLAIAEAYDIPFATADFAKGVIPEDHPLALGCSGYHESVVSALRASDLVVAIGVRMSVQLTQGWDRSQFENLVQIDDYALDVGRNFPVRLGLVGDLKASVSALRATLRGTKNRNAAAWVQELRATHGVYELGDDLPPRGTARSMLALREATPRDVRVVGDSGLTLQYLKRYFPVYSPDTFYCLYSTAAMGSALPLAIGVALADPSKPVVCVIGDGGLLLYLSELAVAARYRLQLVVVVVNNNGYKQVADRAQHYMGTATACSLPEVDFVAAARACGCQAERVPDAERLGKAVRVALNHPGPTVIELPVDGDHLFQVTPRQLRATWVDSFPEADLPWPFLDND